MMKLLLTWDIKPGRDQDYFEFMVREFAPGITKLGLTPREAWFAVYGECPQIMMESTADDLDTMRELLESSAWAELHEELMEYVENYEQRVVKASSRFQL